MSPSPPPPRCRRRPLRRCAAAWKSPACPFPHPRGGGALVPLPPGRREKGSARLALPAARRPAPGPTPDPNVPTVPTPCAADDACEGHGCGLSHIAMIGCLRVGFVIAGGGAAHRPPPPAPVRPSRAAGLRWWPPAVCSQAAPESGDPVAGSSPCPFRLNLCLPVFPPSRRVQSRAPP